MCVVVYVYCFVDFVLHVEKFFEFHCVVGEITTCFQDVAFMPFPS